MAGNSFTPGAVHSAIDSNQYLIGPLSRIVQSFPDAPISQPPILAIWRNEVGNAAQPCGQSAS